MIDSAILDAMLAAGASAEVIVAAVKADAAREDARREAQRAGNARRQRRYRDRLHGDETGDLFEGAEAGGGDMTSDCGDSYETGAPGSPLRHAGLVPASTAQQASSLLSSRDGGPRNKSGVTGGKDATFATVPPGPASDGADNAGNASHDAVSAVTGAIPPSLDKSPQTPKINPNPRVPVGAPARGAGPARRFPCPDGCDPNDWRDLLANRRTKRLAMTDAAYRKLIRDLAAQADDEWPPGRLLAHAAEKGWAQIFDPRDDPRGASRHGNRPPSRSTTTRNPGEPQNPLVRAVLRSEARGAGGGGTGF
ncbi:MAG: hypothetical protein V4610_18315 [Pseudomonadota bacterium]|jgi:hypothetical protein